MTIRRHGVAGGGLLDRLACHRNRTDPFCHLLTGDNEQTISFVDFFGQAEEFRERYEQASLAPGSVIVIATEFSAQGMYAFVGALIGGFIPAFLAPLTEKQHVEVFAETITSIIQYTQPAAIVVTPGQVQRFIPPELPTILAEPAAPEIAGGERAWAAPNSDDIAFMQFSSGTTGLRKGVMLPHGAVLAQVDAFVRAAPLGEGDLIASWLPLYHDMGLIACFIIPLVVGIPISLQDPIEWVRSPERLLAAIARHRATHVWLPNFAFNHLRLSVPDSERYDLSSIKAFISCSEPCKAATFDAFLDRFRIDGVQPGMLATSYAMAEAVFAVTQSPIGRMVPRLMVARESLQTQSRLVPVEEGPDGVVLMSAGKFLSGIEIVVFDSERQPVDDGVIGEIALAGNFMFGGYYANRQATDAAMYDGWFLTGDLGAVLDGEVFITGRLKDIIIVNGRNYYAHDIEACASGVEGVKPGRVAAFAIENHLSGSEQVVVVVETSWDPGQHHALHHLVKKAIDETLGLTAVRPYPVQVGWLVKTTSGKMSRKDNREKYLSEREQPMI